MNSKTNVWVKLGQILFFLVLLYYFWIYIAGFLIICGVWYLYQEWEKLSRK